jgi:hypothetical protein
MNDMRNPVYEAGLLLDKLIEEDAILSSKYTTETESLETTHKAWKSGSKDAGGKDLERAINDNYNNFKGLNPKVSAYDGLRVEYLQRILVIKCMDPDLRVTNPDTIRKLNELLETSQIKKVDNRYKDTVTGLRSEVSTKNIDSDSMGSKVNGVNPLRTKNSPSIESFLYTIPEEDEGIDGVDLSPTSGSECESPNPSIDDAEERPASPAARKQEQLISIREC